MNSNNQNQPGASAAPAAAVQQAMTQFQDTFTFSNAVEHLQTLTVMAIGSDDFVQLSGIDRSNLLSFSQKLQDLFVHFQNTPCYA